MHYLDRLDDKMMISGTRPKYSVVSESDLNERVQPRTTGWALVYKLHARPSCVERISYLYGFPYVGSTHTRPLLELEVRIQLRNLVANLESFFFHVHIVFDQEV